MSKLFSKRILSLLVSISLVLVFTVSITILAKPANSSELVEATFAVISDNHLAIGEPQNTWKMYHYNWAILLWAIDEVNSRGDIDFVLVPGDLTKHSEPYNHRLVKKLLDKLDVPYYVVPGNHDVKKSDMPPENWDIDEFVKAYQGCGYQGTDAWYSTDPVPGLHLVGLDSSSDPKFIASWGGAVSPQKQIDWLEKDLAQNKEKTTIVMVHHALMHHEGKDDPRSYCENADLIKKILKKYGVQVAITGHLHVTDIAQEDELWDIASPAICSYPCAYRIFKLTGNELYINTIWYPDKKVREVAKSELIKSGETKTGAEQIGDVSDRWTVLELRSPVAVEVK